jgi:hypothetical protein
MAALAACNARPVLTELVAARQSTSELHVQFTKLADATNRTVMTDSDEAARATAQEANQLAGSVQSEIERLQDILQSLGYTEEQQHLATFLERFAEYRKLDAEILSLAVENSNLKAQRLSFGPAREAVEAFRRSLGSVANASAKDRCCVDAMAARAEVAVLDILATHAPHIAEPQDAPMDVMEQKMAAAREVAHRSLRDLRSLVPAAAAADLAAAVEALDRIDTHTREIHVLSRRNTDVQSLALSLGRKRTLAAQCDDALRSLEEALDRHRFTATR